MKRSDPPSPQRELLCESPIPNAESRLLYAGVDEAGRGPLAGPVAVAAVVFDPARTRINGLDDSKQLTAARRETLYARIVERALAWQVVLIEAEEIDRLNIYQATMLGMRRAVEGVAHVAGFARIDGNRVPKGLPCAAEALVGGDGLDRAIMAASIVAKVTRDRIMQQLHAQHPHYGFDLHKGYATPAHLAALAAHGPCAQHRRSFAPVRAASRDRGPGTGDPEQQQIARLPGPI
ncbi:ribonuclease HII [Xanthomonas translucens pv. arrhenatheri]|uniref:Ribonuclease HII n=1 Tax=Xanthomonas graminis pv. arrhenatheri LMG 727 TaxID=1195923 RepID=A0A0K2ZKE5_9XANT|nr:ribonuclease HII [Xanthomonas translucens]OAX65746.1 ribonuclease HII [Xanthomonas translucens pv. arrhenatheri]UKE78928.1 ribonuclease HII [Xanthomonas translucens pv. arrhenatheri]CTP84744.1 Ribonuclease HII [Xanthomonas translucens pv. arrhenatheri LMG 727]